MAMTLRLDDAEAEALRRRADLEGRSMQEVAREAVQLYIENKSKRELLDNVLDIRDKINHDALHHPGK